MSSHYDEVGFNEVPKLINYLLCGVAEYGLVSYFCSLKSGELFRQRAFNSVGLECHLDRVEVTGSSPVTPTIIVARDGDYFCCLIMG